MKEELRLGNWVDYNDYPNKGYTRLNEHLMTCVFSDENWINHFISPIHLTEDILLKCGFEYRIHQYTYKELSIKLSEEYFLVFNMKNGNIYTTNNEERELHSGMYLYDINYLHQLQNLYFALTNQELNIELWK